MSEQFPSSTSLHGFCKQFDLSKTTVHRYCKDQGISTSNGLSAEAVAKLKVAFNVMEPQQNKPSSPSNGELVVHVPQSQIDILPSDMANRLDQLHSQIVMPQTFQPIQMNGTGEEIVLAVFQVAEKVEGMKSANDATEADLQSRREKMQKVDELKNRLLKTAKSELNRNEQLAEEAEAVKAEEAAIKKQLLELLMQ